MPIRARTFPADTRSIFLRELSPTSPSTTGRFENLPMLAFGHAAARETLVTATPHMASLWSQLFEGLLATGPQLRWLGNGPGIGRDARIAYSSLLGRYLARAVLENFQGVRVLVPIDEAKRKLKGTNYSIEKPPGNRGLEADWIGLDASGVVIVEAKGTYDSGIRRWREPSLQPSVLDTAIGQVRRTRVFRKSPRIELPARRWAIASRWGTEENGRDPTVIAWDPVDGELPDKDYKELSGILKLADIEAVLDGLGHGDVLAALEGLSPVDDGPKSVTLRVGEQFLEPGFVAGFGPYGARPIRQSSDLLHFDDDRENLSESAIVSFSKDYIDSVLNGEDFEQDEVGGTLKEKEPNKRMQRNGLTIIWPTPKSSIRVVE